MSEEEGSYMNLAQKEHLVEFMRKYYDFLFRTKTPNANAKKKNLWELLTCVLNSIGPNKTTDGWKRSFIALKAATKKKLKKSQENPNVQFNEVEMKIIQFCKMNSERGFTSAEAEDANIAVLRIQNAAKDFASNQLLSHDENHRGRYEGANVTEDGTKILEQQGAPDLHLHQQLNLSLVQQPLPLLQERSQNATVKQKQNKTKNAALEQREKEPQNATLEQKQKLVDLIGQHFDALYGRVSNSLNGDVVKKKIWKSITLQLNKIGAKKQVDFWKRCFIGLKGSTKDKLTILRQNKNRIDPILVEFDDFDKKIIKMYKLKTMDGSKELKELGLEQTIHPTSSTVTSRDDYLLHLQTVESPEHEQTQEQEQSQEQQQEPLEQRQEAQEPPPQPLLQPQSPQPTTTSATTTTPATTSTTATTTMPQPQRPQRRGVEINLNRYVDAHGIADFDNDDEYWSRRIPDFDADDEERMRGLQDFEDEEDHRRRPRGRGRPDRRRRYRVTIPLSVMAVNSLKEQKKTNSLLAELLFEFRNRP